MAVVGSPASEPRAIAAAGLMTAVREGVYRNKYGSSGRRCPSPHSGISDGLPCAISRRQMLH